MATKIFETEDIELQDGTVLTVTPLPIKNLRKFMEVITKLSDVKDEKEVMEILFDAAQVAVEKYDPVLGKDREKLEEVLDMPTMNKLIELAGGVKLNDPNLTAAG